MIFATLILFAAIHPGTSLPHSGNVSAKGSHQTAMLVTKPTSRKIRRRHHPRRSLKSRVLGIKKAAFGKILAIFRGSKKRTLEQARLIALEKHRKVQDQKDIQERVKNHELVPLRSTSTYMVGGVNPNFRYCTPGAFQFLEIFAAKYHEHFKVLLDVTSAVRTPNYQKQLSKNNKNAAASIGPKASSHLYGLSLDITTVNMSAEEMTWVQEYLKLLAKEGKIFVIQEGIAQHCFHITVFDKYLSPHRLRTTHLTAQASVS